MIIDSYYVVIIKDNNDKAKYLRYNSTGCIYFDDFRSAYRYNSYDEALNHFLKNKNNIFNVDSYDLSTIKIAHIEINSTVVND